MAAGVVPLPFADEARAQAVWLGGTDSDYHTASNWSPAAVPNSTITELLFGPAALNMTMSMTAGSNAGAFVFEVGAPSFTFNIGPADTGYGLHGAGIVNYSGLVQTINLHNAGLIMNNSASMDANVILNMTGSSQVDLKDSSSGGLAAFNLNSDRGILITGDNHAVSMGSLSGTGWRVQFSGHNQSLTIGGNNQSTSYSGELRETGSNASLIKVGTGTLTLSGSNYYTGGTTISGGVLSVSSNGHLGAASGWVTLNGGTLRATGTAFNSTSRSISLGALGGGMDINNAANNFTVTQGISGPGGLTKLGAGTLILAGNSSYSGATTVSAGRLLVNGSIASSSLTTVEAGGTLGGTGTVGNTAVNAGGILSAGLSPGTLTVAGDMTLNAGSTSVFELGAPGVVGGPSNDLVVVTGNLSLGGTLQTPGAVSGYYRLFDVAGMVSGAFAAIPAGTTVSTDIPHQVNLLLNQGGQRVQFWDGADQVGNGTVDGGTGTWNATNTNWTGAPGQAGINDRWRGEVGVFTGAAGTVTTSGGLSFEGLQFKTDGYHLAGNTLTMTGDSQGNAAASFVNVDGGITAEISAPLAGAGIGLDKLGGGTLILTGSHAYTGATAVKSGTLLVNGSIASSSLTTVDAGAVLGGEGTVGNTFIDGGVLSPGNSIGALTVAGNLTLTAASTYLVEISPTSSDLTHVTGTATLGGATMAAQFAPGGYVEKRYTILTADGGISGTFSGPVNTNLPANFKSALAYDGNNAYLDLALSFQQEGLRVNQRNVARALAGFFNSTGGLPFSFGALTARGLTQAAGEAATGAPQAAFEAQSHFLNAMTDPFVGGQAGASAPASPAMSYAAEGSDNGSARDASASLVTKAPPAAPPFAQRWQVFGAAYGGTARVNGNAAVGSHDATSRVYGGMGGAAYALAPDTRIGFALGGGGTAFALSDGLGSGRSDLFQAGVFARHGFGHGGYLTGAFAYGWHDVTTERVALTGERLRGAYKANVLSGRVEAGWRMETALAGVTPYAAAQTISYRLPSYLEQGNGAADSFALGYASRNVAATRSELGLRFDRTTVLNDALVTLRGRAAWAHNFDRERALAATFQALPGTGFLVNGAAQAADAALVSAGAEIRWQSGLSLAATFEGEFSSTTTSYAGKGVIRYAW